MVVCGRILNIILCLGLLCQFQAKAIKEPTSPLVKLDAEMLSSGIVHNEGIYLPRGLTIPVELLSPIDTRINQVSDAITAKTTADLVIADYVVIPANSFLHGYISQLTPPGRMHKAAQVELCFQSISIPDLEKNKRKEVRINGRVRAKEILVNSDKVNDGNLYKKRLLKTAPVAALGSGVMAYAITESISPFATFGIETILSGLTIVGAAGAGAYATSLLLTKDDIRMEPGTKLNVTLSDDSLNDFHAAESVEILPELELSPGELYDRMGQLESLDLLQNRP